MNEPQQQTRKPAVSAAEQKKRRNRIRVITRTVIQIAFFLVMPNLFSSAFAGVKNIFQRIAAGQPLVWNGFTITLVLLAAFTLLFGRFFCGFCCAFGSLGDWIWALSAWLQKLYAKKRKKKPHLPVLSRKAQRGLQLVKFVILAAIVVLCAAGIYGSLSGWSPWDVFSMFVSRRLRLAGYTLGLVLLILILLGMAWKERFFCQFLCPMGAVFALLPCLPLLSLRRNRPNCLKGCSACEQKCPTGVALDTDALCAGECIRCGKCGSACPKGNISTGISALHGNEWWAFLIQAGILLAAALLVR